MDLQTKLKYQTALNCALEMMSVAELEPTSALKQAANDVGIQYGAEMQSFVSWANDLIENGQV